MSVDVRVVKGSSCFGVASFSSVTNGLGSIEGGGALGVGASAGGNGVVGTALTMHRSDVLVPLAIVIAL
jgi:hypothetical protein